jgi:hypothetical protein
MQREHAQEVLAEPGFATRVPVRGERCYLRDQLRVVLTHCGGRGLGVLQRCTDQLEELIRVLLESHVLESALDLGPLVALCRTEPMRVALDGLVENRDEQDRVRARTVRRLGQLLQQLDIAARGLVRRVLEALSSFVEDYDQACAWDRRFSDLAGSLFEELDDFAHANVVTLLSALQRSRNPSNQAGLGSAPTPEPLDGASECTEQHHVEPRPLPGGEHRDEPPLLGQESIDPLLANSRSACSSTPLACSVRGFSRIADQTSPQHRHRRLTGAIGTSNAPGSLTSRAMEARRKSRQHAANERGYDVARERAIRTGVALEVHRLLVPATNRDERIQSRILGHRSPQALVRR